MSEDQTLISRWQSVLAQAEQRSLQADRPGTLSALLIAHGQWTPEQALSEARMPEGGFFPRALEATAPFLGRAQVAAALRELEQHPPFRYRLLGARALLNRAAAVGAEPEAVAAVGALPLPLRVELFASVAPLLSEDERPAWIAEVREAATTAFKPPDQTRVLLSMLPWIPDAERPTLITVALSCLDDVWGWPTSPSFITEIARVAPQRALLAAAHETEPVYGFIQRISCVIRPLDGLDREAATRAWLDAVARYDPKRLGLLGNVIPTPLSAEVLARLLALLSEKAGPAEQSYVLITLAAAHPELLERAVASLDGLAPGARAMAALKLAPLLEPAPQGTLIREAIAALEAKAGRIGRDLFNLQRAWFGWDAETVSAAEWQARAIRMLPAAEQGPYLDALLEQCSTIGDHADRAGTIARLAARLSAGPDRRRIVDAGLSLLPGVEALWDGTRPTQQKQALGWALLSLGVADQRVGLCAAFFQHAEKAPIATLPDGALLSRALAQLGEPARAAVVERLLSEARWNERLYALLAEAPPALVHRAWDAVQEGPMGEQLNGMVGLLPLLPEADQPGAVDVLAELPQLFLRRLLRKTPEAQELAGRLAPAGRQQLDRRPELRPLHGKAPAPVEAASAGEARAQIEALLADGGDRRTLLRACRGAAGAIAAVGGEALVVAWAEAIVRPRGSR